MEDLSLIFRMVAFLAGLLLPATTGGIIVWSLQQKRWIKTTGLFLAPVFPLFGYWLFKDQIFANGNLLAAAIFGLFILAVFVYYPVIIAISVFGIVWKKFTRKDLDNFCVCDIHHLDTLADQDVRC